MTIYKKLVFFSFLLFVFQATAQNDETKIHEEINLKIWKPFCASYDLLDAKTYNALHTEDVIRVTPWGIRVGDEYKDRNVERFKAKKEKGTDRTIELWFEHQKTTSAISYEVGYYRVTYKNAKGSNYSYGRFHVLLKKENGNWKIAQDWDTDKINGIEITEVDWLKGSTLVFE